MVTRPESGLSNPDSTYSSEVLPAPDGPTIAVKPAPSISNETLLRTVCVLVIFDVEQRFALVAELVFIVACYGAYFLQQWVRKRKKATEADDLDTLWVARD